MNKKRFGLLLWLLILGLEISSYGAVCNFSDGPDRLIRRTFSYFDLIPFGYANFGPLLTGILSVFAVVFLLLYLLTGKHLHKVQILSMVAFVTSLMPLMFGIHYFSPVGALISVLLLLSYFWCGKLST